jgi:hypothetical protein
MVDKGLKKSPFIPLFQRGKLEKGNEYKNSTNVLNMSRGFVKNWGVGRGILLNESF